MIPVKQTILHDPANGLHGNCLSAVLASVLHLQIDQVPVFSNPQTWLQDLNAWLRPFGLAFISLRNWQADWQVHGISGCWHEISGISPRNAEVFHSIVARDGAPAFDPHPDGNGIAGGEAWFGFFVALDASQLVGAHQAFDGGFEQGFENLRGQVLRMCEEALKPLPSVAQLKDWDAGFDAAMRCVHSCTRVMQPKEPDAAPPQVDRAEAMQDPVLLAAELQQVRSERDRLQQLINTPELVDFAKAVQMEAAHQELRWGSADREGKGPYEWFWLLSHLATRALEHHKEAERLRAGWGVDETHEAHHAAIIHHREKAVHHCITSAAMLAHWHAAVLGKHTSMWPGAHAPQSDVDRVQGELA